MTSTLANRANAAALHMIPVLQLFQVKLLRDMDESGGDPSAFKELCMLKDLTSIGKAMANLVVLKHFLWLNLTEIRDKFTKCFAKAQKMPQAQCHFLSKRPSSASVSSLLRSA